MVNSIVVFMHRPTKVRRLFQAKYSSLEVLKPGATRFGSQYLMLKRYLEVQDNLRSFMVSDDWESCGLENRPGITELMAFVADRDKKQQCIELQKLLEPVYEVLRYVDTRVYCAGDLYTDLFNLKSKLQRACERHYHILESLMKVGMTEMVARAKITQDVMGCLQSRWSDVIQNELHGSAYLLHPCTPATKWKDETLRQAFMGLVAKWYPCEAGLQHTLLMQLELFEGECGDFGKEAAQWAKKQLLAERKMTPAQWWRMYGRHLPGICDLAVKVLSQPITSSDCERCFSLFGAVQRKNRRTLHAPRMMSTVRVTFAKQSIKWAQEMAAKRQKVVSQCAMQTASDDAPDSLSLSLPPQHAHLHHHLNSPATLRVSVPLTFC